MIDIRNIGKFYGRHEAGRPVGFYALKGFNLLIEDHEFLSIIGPSGCGKTTLLKMVDGLIPWDEGEILIDGKLVSGPGPDRGVVFQNFALLPWADVMTNVGFGLELRGVKASEREAVVLEYIRAVGLDGFARHYPRQLSGGMQQRVGLARALAVDPEILLLDEPFGSVDAQTRRLLQHDLTRLWETSHKTAIFVTHDMEEAIYLSDRVALIRPRPGSVQEILKVSLPRPRTEEMKKEKSFVELREYLWEQLKQMQQSKS